MDAGKKGGAMSISYDVLFFALFWAVAFFALILDALIESIIRDRRRQRR